jgi:hypothetical protein
MHRINVMYQIQKYIIQETATAPGDTVAEWSKAPGSGPGSKERGFKSHRCHEPSRAAFYRLLRQITVEYGHGHKRQIYTCTAYLYKHSDCQKLCVILIIRT